MTPDVYTNFEIVNATDAALVVGTQPSQGLVSYNQYQMQQWFTWPAAPSPICASGTTAAYTAQFLRGVGDEDDAADLLFNFGNAGDQAFNLFVLQARSLSNSGHYIQITPCPGTAIGHFVLGIVNPGTLQDATSTQVTWYALAQGNAAPIGLGCSNTQQAIIVANLDHLYDAATAANIFQEISAGPAADEILGDLYAQVVGYALPDQTTMRYSLMDVVFNNPPAPSQGGTVVLGQTTVNLQAGSLTQTISMSKTVSNTFELTSTSTWGIGVEVGFEALPIPFSPNVTINGSFEHDQGESSSVTESFDYGIETAVTVPEPGEYTITAFVQVADNYKASFSGTLELAGTVADGTTAQRPLNSTVLAAIMRNPERNAGYNAGPLTAGEDSLTAEVQGQMVASFGYNSNVSVVAGDGSHARVAAVSVQKGPPAVKP